MKAEIEKRKSVYMEGVIVLDREVLTKKITFE